MIANVTYGYTSANFSGRMPCIEVGDSVVSKGRETLERAIKIIEAIDDQGRPRWPGAKVVYGELIFFITFHEKSCFLWFFLISEKYPQFNLKCQGLSKERKYLSIFLSI